MFKLNSHVLFLPDKKKMMEVTIKQNILSNYDKNTAKNALISLLRVMSIVGYKISGTAKKKCPQYFVKLI